MPLLVVLIVSLVIIFNFIIGTIILLRGLKDKIKILFGFLSISIALWCFGILGFYLVDLPSNFSSGWIVLTHFSAALLALIFLYFTFYFPFSLIRSRFIKLLPLIPFLIIVYFLFFTKSIIGNVIDIKYEIGLGYVFYSLYIIFYFFLGYLSLLIQYKKTTNFIQKKRIVYVFWGAVLSSTFATITDLIFPFVNIFNYTWLGPVFTIFLIGAIAYAILRHHLFNIRIIATEILTFAIWIFLLIRTVLSLTEKCDYCRNNTYKKCLECNNPKRTN